MENIENNDVDDNVRDIKDTDTLIFYAPWCGHCKKAKSEFNQAVTDSDGKIKLINGDSYPELVKKYNVKYYPYIIKDNTEYKGPLKSKNLVELADS